MHSDSEEEGQGSTSNANGPSPKKKRKINGVVVVNGANGRALSNGTSNDIKLHRTQLPIWTGKAALVSAVKNNDTVVVLGETGSGKTTQLPQFLHEAGLTRDGIIAVTQPRRVAAISLAARVALEQGTPLGQLVGYNVRFDEHTTRNTRIKFCTDGMLVRELLIDSDLDRYSVVVVDEAHERTLRTDMLLGSLKRIQRERKTGEKRDRDGKKMKPLKVVVMSATLDAERFSAFFNRCPVLYISGRQHPVQICHSKTPVEDFQDAALRTFLQLHLDHPPGDVLVFLPGQDDIESLAKSIRAYIPQVPPSQQKVLVLPLYGALPPEQQKKIFDPPPAGTRKVVLATNIAETSITIPGIRYVIDTGLCKERSYHTRHGGSGLDELLVKPISKSSAQQRSGRAGREAPGTCFRLYTEQSYNQLTNAPTPEIQRCDLNSAILDLKCLGEDPMEFAYMDRPLDDSIRGSLITLYALQALDSQGRLTRLGRRLASFPLEPALSLVVLSSQSRACTAEILDIVSLLTCTAKLFIDNADTREAAADARKKFQHRDGDHLTLLNIFRSFEDVLSSNLSAASSQANGGPAHTGSRRAAREWCKAHFLNEKALNEATTIRTQLRGNCEREKIDWKVSCGDDAEPVLRCLLDGLFRKSAIKAPDGTYRQIGMQQVLKIHPSSSLVDRKPPTIIFDELLITSAVYARGVSAVHSSWLIDTPLLNSNARGNTTAPYTNGHT
ncbi:P-loop containing nucleoside triphosphate hydrolase protein [Calocera viscosa TUFC12733]|uniref:RNA helicase n=1 Tax=Calocera viscosa (strain TUFC12733) TaxID=1330018 RepID=A0A167RIN6_CALVF|nr:P-loop containing nucleoside triphosphate hydrolase protein [Calocera viscosa TUFC12733]